MCATRRGNPNLAHAHGFFVAEFQKFRKGVGGQRGLPRRNPSYAIKLRPLFCMLFLCLLRRRVTHYWGTFLAVFGAFVCRQPPPGNPFSKPPRLRQLSRNYPRREGTLERGNNALSCGQETVLGGILGDNLGEGNCESKIVSKHWGDNFCRETSRCLAGPSGY